MTAIVQTEGIDAVSLEAGTGLIRLKMIVHLPWDAAHLLALQGRINHYLQFIESGQIYLSYPQAQGCDFAIDVQSIYAPDTTALAFLMQARQVLDEAGYGFGWQPLGSSYAEDAPSR